MNDELIKTLIRQILSEPTFQAILQGNGIQTAPGTSNLSRKPDCLVLLNYVSDLAAVLNTLEKHWGATNTLYLLPSESVKRVQSGLPEGLNWTTPQDALDRRNWQSILLPTCSLNTLAKMALGIRDNPFTELLGRSLVQGTPIKLITESFGFTDQTPPAYRELYDGYLQNVQRYGVTVYADLTSGSPQENQRKSEAANEINKSAIQSSEIQTSIQVQVQPQAQNILHFTKKLLTDKDAYSFPEDSKVLIPQRVVISPLARDTLRMRRIELCQEREEQRQCY